MQNPFQENYIDQDDNELIRLALNGSQDNLVELIGKHQNFIYNIAFKMVLSPYDAEDITQEILIKVITKLSQFNGKSKFRTWLYRITVNHILQMKKKWLEERYHTISLYEADLDEIAYCSLSDFEQIEMKETIEEARLGCMAGMLLCLSREQRIVFILGEIFAIPHDFGAEILDISKENFRQRLSRARYDLYQFMNKKCGLINKSNPCRCQKKTKGFIAAGWVDPQRMKFNTSYTKRIYELVDEKDVALQDLEENKYRFLQREHPFQEKEFAKKIVHKIFTDKDVHSIFEI